MILSVLYYVQSTTEPLRLVFRECIVNITLIFFADLFGAQPFLMSDFTVILRCWALCSQTDSVRSLRRPLAVTVSHSLDVRSWGVNFTSVRSNTFHRGLLQPVGCGGLNNIVCFDCG